MCGDLLRYGCTCILLRAHNASRDKRDEALAFDRQEGSDDLTMRLAPPVPGPAAAAFLHHALSSSGGRQWPEKNRFPEHPDRAYNGGVLLE